MQEVEGLVALRTELERLDAGTGFPFYCMLLATGGDPAIAELVSHHWWDLHEMTGDGCLVFSMSAACPSCGLRGIGPHDSRCPRCGKNLEDGAPRIRDLYRLADEFGVRYASMPCAVFFTEPRTSAERLALRLTPFAQLTSATLDRDSQADHLMVAFRVISDAINVACAEGARGAYGPDERLAKLREALIDERRRYEGRLLHIATGEDAPRVVRLQDAAGSVEAIKTLGGAGVSISGVLLRALGHL